MTERLDDFEDDGVAQRRVGTIELTRTHHAFSEITCREYRLDLEMAHTDVSDLALPEKAVADQIARALAVDIGEQSDRCIEMREVVLGLGDLRLIGADPAMDLPRAYVSEPGQRVDRTWRH